MAEENESSKQIDDALKTLAESINKFGAKTKNIEDRISDLGLVLKAQSEIARKETKTTEEELEAQRRIDLRSQNLQKTYTEEYKRHVEKIKRLQSSKEITESEAVEAIDSFRESFSKNISDPALKIQFENLGAAAEQSANKQIQMQGYLDTTVAGIRNLTENALKPAAAMLGTLAKGYQTGAGQAGIASDLFQTGIAATGGLLQNAGSAAKSAGESLTAMGGRGRAAGIVLQGLGTAASLAGSGLSVIAQQVLPFLATELENNISRFQSLSSSGALFSNGLTGMIQSAGTAGLTLKQFESFVKSNSETLAGLGESVSGGANRAARALNAGGDTMRRQLLNLGFSIEEQAGLVAETMRDMRQAGQPLAATDSQIAQQTQKYAENLRIIASVTGEDAKKKMEEARRAAQDLAFQQKLQGMSGAQQQEVIAAMGNMNEVQRQAFQEMVTFGSVITPGLAATVAQSENLQASVNASFAAFQAGTLSSESQREIAKQYNEGIKQDMLALTGLAQAGAAGVGGVVSEVYKGLNTVYQDVLKQTPEAIAAAEKAAREQSKTTDDLTESMNKVVLVNQKMAEEIQQAILNSGVMTKYADAVQTATNAMLGMIKQFTGTGGPGSENKTEEQKTQESKEGAIAGAMQGAMLGAVLGPWGAAGGALIGGIYGALKNRSTEEIGNAMRGVGPNAPTSEQGVPMFVPGAAGGGILSGPSSGYPVMLHGREMVVPLPDDLSPTEVKKSSLTDLSIDRDEVKKDLLTNEDIMSEKLSLNELAMQEIIRSMQNSMSQTVDPMTKLTEQMEELLRISREIVDNTDRTARGVA